MSKENKYIVEYKKYQPLPNSKGMGMVTNFIKCKDLYSVVKFIRSIKNKNLVKDIYNGSDNDKKIDLQSTLQLIEETDKEERKELYLKLKKEFEKE